MGSGPEKAESLRCTENKTNKQTEPEFLTTETDAGFRFITMSIGDCNYDKIEFYDKRIGWIEPSSPTSLFGFYSDVSRGFIYRIPNPNYKPAREPKVGDVLEDSRDETIAILFPDFWLFYNKSERSTCDRDKWMTSKNFKFTGKTLDLSPLIGGES